jgi:alanine racemase
MLDRRPTRALIDLGALAYNLRALERRARRPVMAVVKADAYGHGALAVARVAREAGAAWLGVATVDEGLELRRAGDGGSILVLGGVYPGEVDDLAEADLTPVVAALPAIGGEGDQTGLTLARLASAARRRGRPIGFHLKVDTGMHRLGIAPDEVDLFLDRVGTLVTGAGAPLRIEGLMSHLACADDPAEQGFTDRQRAALDGALARLEARGQSPGERHVDNSAGLVTAWEKATLVRAGIALYGAHAPEPGLVLPVMSLVSGVAALREVRRGGRVSYGGTFTAARPTLVASVPIGYADGLPRALSGRGEALLGGRRAPIAGRVCMDWTMLDVTDIPGVRVGDPVLWFGRGDDGALPAEAVAATAGTLAYELFCRVSPRVPRRYSGGA